MKKSLIALAVAGAFAAPAFAATSNVDVYGKLHMSVSYFNDGLGKEGEDGNEETDPVTPHLLATDGIYSEDRCFAEALAAGVRDLPMLGYHDRLGHGVPRRGGEEGVQGGHRLVVFPDGRVLVLEAHDLAGVVRMHGLPVGHDLLEVVQAGELVGRDERHVPAIGMSGGDLQRALLAARR